MRALHNLRQLFGGDGASIEAMDAKSAETKVSTSPQRMQHQGGEHNARPKLSAGWWPNHLSARLAELGALVLLLFRIIVALMAVAGAALFLRHECSAELALGQILLHQAPRIWICLLMPAKSIAQSRATRRQLAIEKYKQHRRPGSLRRRRSMKSPRIGPANKSENGLRKIPSLATFSGGCPGLGDKTPTTSHAVHFQRPLLPDQALHEPTAAPRLRRWWVPSLGTAGATVGPADTLVSTSKGCQPPRKAWHSILLAPFLLLASAIRATFAGFWSHIARWCIRSCPGYNGGPSSQNQNEGGAQRESGAGERKRKRKRRANEDQAPGGGNNEGNGNAGNNDGAGGNGDDNDATNKLCFICPFVVHDPATHIGCLGFKLHRWTDLLQHFDRNHCISKEHYCPICYAEFNTTGEYDQHVVGCNSTRQNCDRFTKPELVDIKRTLKTLRATDGDDRHIDIIKWEWVWMMCFREEPPLRLPYQRSVLIECAEILRNEHEPFIRTLIRDVLTGFGVAEEAITQASDFLLPAIFNVPTQPAANMLWRFRQDPTALRKYSRGFGNGNDNGSLLDRGPGGVLVHRVHDGIQTAHHGPPATTSEVGMDAALAGFHNGASATLNAAGQSSARPNHSVVLLPRAGSSSRAPEEEPSYHGGPADPWWE